VVLYTAVAGWIGFGLLFHLPQAVLLSVAVGVLELIPAVGPMTSMTLVGLTGLQQTSTAGLIFLMGYAVALRLSIDNLVGPLVLGRSVKVHPVVVMFAFVCGAMLFGVIGLLFAVPVAACIRLILDHYYAEPIAPGGDAEPEAIQISPQSSIPVSGTAAPDPY
jgi:predicted PurR-regulated permease PerM